MHTRRFEMRLRVVELGFGCSNGLVAGARTTVVDDPHKHARVHAAQHKRATAAWGGCARRENTSEGLGKV